MKKFLALLICTVMITGLIRYNYTTHKRKDIKYTAEKYFTTGIFNDYRLCNISTMNLSFSNGNVAVIKVEGLEQKSPHRKVAYNAFLEKNNGGTWKVKKVYPLDPALKNQ